MIKNFFKYKKKYQRNQYNIKPKCKKKVSSCISSCYKILQAVQMWHCKHISLITILDDGNLHTYLCNNEQHVESMGNLKEIEHGNIYCDPARHRAIDASDIELVPYPVRT